MRPTKSTSPRDRMQVLSNQGLGNKDEGEKATWVEGWGQWAEAEERKEARKNAWKGKRLRERSGGRERREGRKTSEGRIVNTRRSENPVTWCLQVLRSSSFAFRLPQRPEMPEALGLTFGGKKGSDRRAEGVPLLNLASVHLKYLHAHSLCV